jgi:hypothetical protein
MIIPISTPYCGFNNANSSHPFPTGQISRESRKGSCMVLWRKNARSRTPQNGGNMYGGNNVLTLKISKQPKSVIRIF